MSNCPNCGAPVTGHRCAYCETIFSKSVTEEDELTKLISNYCDGLDTWEQDYKRMVFDLQRLAAESSRVNKFIDWSGILGMFIPIAFTGVVIALTLFGSL